MTAERRILLCARWPVGGIRTYLRYVYRDFPLDRFRLVLVAPGVAEAEILVEDLKDSVEEVRFCDNSMLSLGQGVLSANREYNFDLVHSHGLSAGTVAGPLCRMIGVKHLLTLHDVFTDRLFAGFVGHSKRALANLALRFPDHIHVLGDDPQNNLAEYFPSTLGGAANIQIIRSGIEVERFAAERDKRENSLRTCMVGADGSRRKLGFFGRFMAQKGFAYLVNAIELMIGELGEAAAPEVVCFGSGGFKDREMRLVQERGLDNVFRFQPFEENVAGAMAGMDGIVMPSRWEAVGLVAMEALVCGVPLIASNCIGLREVTRDTPTFMFESENVESLLQALTDWSSNPRFGEFLEYSYVAEQRFDMVRATLEIRDLYEKITGEE